MKKISILIIGLLALLFSSNINAQKKAGGAIPIEPKEGLRISYNILNAPVYPKDAYELEIKFPCTSTTLIAPLNGGTAVFIDKAAFPYENNYTVDAVCVRIYALKKIDGVWTRYKTALVELNNIFYYDYPSHVKYVDVRLENMQGPN